MDNPAEQLTARDFTEAGEPFALFEQWLAEARTKEINDPDAMALATVDADGMPNVRMVLCRDFDSRGPVFYTNAESAKGQELLTAHKASALFHWKSLRRQIRIRGPVEVVDEAQSDRYFNSRPRDSRIGAWASQQSRPLESRFALEKAVAKYAAKYPVGDVPRPSYWKGFRIRPVQFEFWSDGAFRLHNRIDFRRETPEGDWRKQRLYP